MDRDQKVVAAAFALTFGGAILWVVLLATVGVYGPLVSEPRPPVLAFAAEVGPPVTLMFAFYMVGKKKGRKEAGETRASP